MKKLLTVLLALLLCFSLTACKNDEKESSETTVKETTISETVVETPVEETTTTEEVVEVEEDTTKVTETTNSNNKPTITAKSYVLHEGLADGITLIVKRISSKVGADLTTINPESTKLYEGDVIEVAISTTKTSMTPIYNVTEASKLNTNQYTILASDVTITTGYDYEKETAKAEETSNDVTYTYTYVGAGQQNVTVTLSANELLSSNRVNYNVRNYAFNGYIYKTAYATWYDAINFVSELNGSFIWTFGLDFTSKTNGYTLTNNIKVLPFSGANGYWRLLNVDDTVFSDGSSWANVSESSGDTTKSDWKFSDYDTKFGGAYNLWSSVEYNTSNAYCWNCKNAYCPNGSKSYSSQDIGFVVIWQEKK